MGWLVNCDKEAECCAPRIRGMHLHILQKKLAGQRQAFNQPICKVCIKQVQATIASLTTLVILIWTPLRGIKHTSSISTPGAQTTGLPA